MSVPVVAIVGVSGAGKTTLLEKLLPELRRRGYKVGTLKHDAHDFEMDRPGKDSYRHFRAGAAAAGIASKQKLGLVRKLERPLELREIVDGFFTDMDIVLTEGFKRSEAPKIEVSRRALRQALICDPEKDRLAAVVADYQPRLTRKIRVVTGQAAYSPLSRGVRGLFSPRRSGGQDVNTPLSPLDRGEWRLPRLDDGGTERLLPVFGLDDVKRIADFLEQNFMKDCCALGKGSKVSLVVDGKKIPLNPFVKEFITGIIEGMAKALKGVKSPKSVRVTVSR